jgi:hypothetical protein
MEPSPARIRLGVSDEVPGRELMLKCVPRPIIAIDAVGGHVEAVSVDGRQPNLWAIIPVRSAELWQVMLELGEREQRFFDDGA